VNSDQIGQGAVARTGLRQAILAAKSLTRVEGRPGSHRYLISRHSNINHLLI
jgi:hypothetical protein